VVVPQPVAEQRQDEQVPTLVTGSPMAFPRPSDKARTFRHSSRTASAKEEHRRPAAYVRLGDVDTRRRGWRRRRGCAD
jgi:hypothetical protein